MGETLIITDPSGGFRSVVVKSLVCSILSSRAQVILFFLLLGTFLVPYLGLLQPLGETMLAVKRELCYGNQTFVVGESLDMECVPTCELIESHCVAKESYICHCHFRPQ